MSRIQTRPVHGFTLVELLIVVIILAVLAAVALPQFSSSTTDAQNAAIQNNLATVRSAIELYKAQHNGIYPGASASTGGTCPTGATSGANSAGSSGAFTDQLNYPSNASGQTCTSLAGDSAAGFKYGPYLRKGIPAEATSGVSTITVTTTGAPITASGNGWAYDTVSGQFISENNPSY